MKPDVVRGRAAPRLSESGGPNSSIILRHHILECDGEEGVAKFGWMVRIPEKRVVWVGAK